jgi:hypothetical protein
MATVTDEIIDLHDRILGKLFNAAKNKHQQQFQVRQGDQCQGAAVRRIGQALIEAKQSGRDPFAAIEAVMSWDAFAESVTEAQKLAQPEDFDFLHRIGESYATLRRYARNSSTCSSYGRRPPPRMCSTPSRCYAA